MKKFVPAENRGKHQVAVLADHSSFHARGVLLGVTRFLREYGGWSVRNEQRRWMDQVPEWFLGWSGDGVIMESGTPELICAVQRLGMPVVDIGGSIAGCSLPLVDTDHRITASLIADYLMVRGFRHYAFCGVAGTDCSGKQSRYFLERLSGVASTYSIYFPPEMSWDPQIADLERRGLLFPDCLGQWLRSLPKPVGIMAGNDNRGLQVINACHRMNLVMPDEIAVVGVGNDEARCILADPPLTSITLDTLQTGYEAAALLNRMMKGEKPPAEPIMIPPLNIVTRRSSAVIVRGNEQFGTAGRRGSRALKQEPVSGVNVCS